jgi:thiamine biosynthesis protein ThiI
MSMRLLTLVSGGIDSPVAGHLMMERGHQVDLIHFDNRPFTDDNTYDKVVSLVKRLDPNKGSRFFVAPHGPSQAQMARKAPRRLGCVLCRRMMLHVASALAEREGHDALVTGESLGQVASQTLLNLWVEEPASTVPILRPLIGLDKLEIISIAKAIGTYDISISPGLCCTIVPSRPATQAKLNDIRAAEAKVGMGGLVKKELEGTKVVRV